MYNRCRQVGTGTHIVGVVFGVVFAVIFIGLIANFAFIGYVGYKVASDPEATAEFVGNIAAKAIAPVANELRK